MEEVREGEVTIILKKFHYHSFVKTPVYTVYFVCGRTAGQVQARETDIKAAAGRPSGRRPFIATGGLGASAPIIVLVNNFLLRGTTQSHFEHNNAVKKFHREKML
ncbi:MULTISPECIES: hypothetical protein [unclassified Methanoregula]|uniref:hypothetical protein n=1 Tax=unclassified Methanoregula TaxID=2649730 RepID=UPI0025F2EFA8|nr:MULTISPECIES: hypothetical protein [unclassified Methanoregula]